MTCHSEGKPQDSLYVCLDIPAVQKPRHRHIEAVTP